MRKARREKEEPRYPALIGQPQVADDGPQEPPKPPPRKLRPLHARRPAPHINRKVFQATRKDADVKAAYDWEGRKELGSGGFGTVFAVKSRFNAKKLVAIKQVPRDSEQLEQLRMEISVLSTLDHPRVLHFFEAYEDFKHIYIVTELCSGGDLQQCLQPMKGQVAFARHSADQILRALCYCHSRGVCHRDLKPENVLLVRKLAAPYDTPMRLADFGLSRKLKATQKSLSKQISHIKSRCSESSVHDLPMNSFVGTAEYMAPEVMAVLAAQEVRGQPGKCYDFRCDLWSLGVIIYCLLKGEPPYSLEELVAYVEDQQELPALKAQPSQGFVEQCLVLPYQNRPSARQLAKEPFLEDTSTFARIDKDGSGTLNLEELREFLLSQPAMKQSVTELFERLDVDKDGVITPAEFHEGLDAFAMSKEVVADIVQKVEKFTQTSQLKKAVLTSAARHLEGYELQKLREVFESVDGNGDGAISKEEWNKSFTMAGASAEWLEQAFESLDTDDSGEIDYREFLAAVMDVRLLERRDVLWAAFQDFDQSNVGSISKENLLQVLQGDAVMGVLQMENKETFVEQLLSQVSADDFGELSFEGFVELLQLC